jgi:glutamate-ammonia-ligase adenylyltransferase
MGAFCLAQEPGHRAARLRGQRLAQAAARVVLPFVFRRYLDYNVFDALRTLHRQIREHAAKRSAGPPERANDVKLSRGGIREIEFTCSCCRWCAAASSPSCAPGPRWMRCSAWQAGLMPQGNGRALAAAYEFLRRVEHRIQYLDDQQTHVLPTRDDDLAWIARTMGFAACCAFLHELDTHREVVAQEFDILLGTPGDQLRLQGLQRPQGRGAAPAGRPGRRAGRLPEKFRERVATGASTPACWPCATTPACRLVRLVQRTALAARRPVSEDAAVRMADWIEPLLRRESYLALLLERPTVHERLLRCWARPNGRRATCCAPRRDRRAGQRHHAG